MSDLANEQLLERAAELADLLQNEFVFQDIGELAGKNDLEELRAYVAVLESAYEEQYDNRRTS